MREGNIGAGSLCSFYGVTLFKRIHEKIKKRGQFFTLYGRKDSYNFERREDIQLKVAFENYCKQQWRGVFCDVLIDLPSNGEILIVSIHSSLLVSTYDVD